ncbi:MAG: hypothetical protein CMH54_11735 [Myxococcales bacterium]|nr:hypothetical protein [Myxococcales bacterium]
MKTNTNTKVADWDDQAIAIIGKACVLPGGLNTKTFAQFLLQSQSAITEVPEDRWRIDDFYDPDPASPFGIYSRIGSFIRDFEFQSLRFRIPPKVADRMDHGQRWIVTAAADALEDAGYGLDNDFDRTRVGVVIGNSMGGEQHVRTSMTMNWPFVGNALRESPSFRELSPEIQERIIHESRQNFGDAHHAPINEDSMPGELANVFAGRIANVLNLRGPNFACDAACASSLATFMTARRMLQHHDCDMAIAGGVDRCNGPEMFAKFCRIGALSADGSFPFDSRASGFVMGEGGAAFVLKRLSDARRDGDRVLGVILGIGASSDGKGKGITAPNPEGQRLAVQRAYKDAGVSPSEVGLLEAHGTGTTVGDAVEAGVLSATFAEAGAALQSVSLGSVKSNIGHLKAGAGAAGMFKALLCLEHNTKLPTINVQTPNPKIGFENTPFRLQLEPEPWNRGDQSRIVGLSAFGFGGTNFHMVLGEAPEDLAGDVEALEPVGLAAWSEENGRMATKASQDAPIEISNSQLSVDTIPGVMLGFAGKTTAEIEKQVDAALAQLETSPTKNPAPVAPGSLVGEWRLVVGGNDLAEAATRLRRAKALVARGERFQGQDVALWNGAPGKVAFVYPGQGSQYVGMGAELCKKYSVAQKVIDDIDTLMEDTIEERLSDIMFGRLDKDLCEKKLRYTVYTQPGVLAMDLALTELVKAYGISPHGVAGHSLGEYGAVAAAGVLDLKDTVRVVTSRAREMANVKIDDPGKMASIIADAKEVDKLIDEIDGMLIAANRNSPNQTVAAGESAAVDKLVERCNELGIRAIPLPVSHAFHSPIVEPATRPLRALLGKLDVSKPNFPIYSDVTAEEYPTGDGAEDTIRDLLGKQVAASVNWIGIVQNMKRDGYDTFVEVGPKSALSRLILDTLGKNVLAVSTNHPKQGDLASFRNALVSLYAAGLGAPSVAQAIEAQASPGKASSATVEHTPSAVSPVCITGASIGLPGADYEMFADDNFSRLLNGENRIESLPGQLIEKMLGKNIERLVKNASGAGSFERITKTEGIIQLGGRPGKLDVVGDYEVPKSFNQALDITTRMVIAAAMEALKDAHIPVVPRYQVTTTGKKLPSGFQIPESIGKDTGVIFASAFPGIENFTEEYDSIVADRESQARVESLQIALETAEKAGASKETLDALSSQLETAKAASKESEYTFDRRFLFRILAMGHTQLAQFLGLKGPSTHVNAACASTTQALGIASDWIRLGRCKRVIVVGADNVSSDRLMPWFGSGFLAAGAATIESDVTQAAVPFGTQRNGMIVGAGAVGLVLEADGLAESRGVTPLVRILADRFGNSAFHGTRLDVEHISELFTELVEDMSQSAGVPIAEMAPNTVFMSHETYTPARGGSSEAEAQSLRRAFGNASGGVCVANVKGYTGHPMGAGIEDGLLVKILQFGTVPPLANANDLDSAFSDLNLSSGGAFDARFGVRLGAGFGSQIALVGFEKIADGPQTIANPGLYQRFLAECVDATAGEVFLDGRILKARVAEGATEMVAPAVQPEAKATPAPTKAPTADLERGAVVQALLQLVSEQTGYPVDMLAPDLDLEADLGIDTVKQAELFASVREAYNIAPVEDLQLSDYATLDKIADFVMARANSGDGAAAPAPAPAATEPPKAKASPAPTAKPAAQDRDGIVKTLLNMVSEQTGYPVDMLAPDLDLEADLGIDTVKQAELFASVREAFNIAPVEDLQLSDYATLNKIADFVVERSGTGSGQTPTETPAPKVEVKAHVAPAPTGSLDRDEVLKSLLTMVAEQSGYPVDMLAPDLDLEADLGIDTVKQAELFASVREKYNIAPVEDLQLSDYATLNKIADFVLERSGTDSAAASTPAETAPVAAAPKAAATAPAPAATEDRGAILKALLEMVAEQTGYPVDMLEPDLDLEADLGIDTVKQAELFAAVREKYGIAPVEDLRLQDYSTLNRITDFVIEYSGTPAADTAPTPPAPAEKKEAAAPATDLQKPAILKTLLDLVSEQTGYPVDMLEPDLDLEADLGIDTVKQAELFATVRETYGIAPVEDLSLQDYSTLNKIADFVLEYAGSSKGTAPTTSEAVQEEAQATGPEATTVGRFVPAWFEGGVAPAKAPTVESTLVVGKTALAKALGIKGKPTALNKAPEKLEENTALAFDLDALPEEPIEAIMQIRSWLLAGPSRVLLVETGITDDDAWVSAPAKAAAAAFAMSYGREHETAVATLHVQLPKVTAPKKGLHPCHASLRDIAVNGQGIGSIRIDTDGSKRVRGLLQADVPSIPEDFAAPKQVLALGGARGITAQMLESLVASGTKKLVLVGRTGPAEDADRDLMALSQQDRRMKLMEELKERGERATPAAVARLESKAEARLEVATNIARFQELGAKVELVLGDATDPAILEAALKKAAKKSHVDLVIHAAGVDYSRLLTRKSEDEIRQVLNVKIAPMQQLMATFNGVSVGSFLTFSSVAAHFGNGGQTDYAAANAALEALTHTMAQRLEGSSCRSIAWGPFADVGMAARPEIAKALSDRGVEFIPLKAGVSAFMEELVCPIEGATHVVRTQELGALASEQIAIDEPDSPLIGLIKGDTGLAREATVTSEIPYLDDHRISGTAVLPGVVGLSMMDEASRMTSGTNKEVSVFESVEFNQAVRVPDGRSTRVMLAPTSSQREGGSWTLNRVFIDPMGTTRVHPHFRARVSSTTSMGRAPKKNTPTKAENWSHKDLYKKFFHGPAFQVLSEVEADAKAGHAKIRKESIDMAAAPLPALLLEAAFQTVGACEVSSGNMGLPHQAEEVRALQTVSSKDGPFRVHVAKTKSGRFNGVVTGKNGKPVVILKGYKTVNAGNVEKD